MFKLYTQTTRHHLTDYKDCVSPKGLFTFLCTVPLLRSLLSSSRGTLAYLLVLSGTLGF